MYPNPYSIYPFPYPTAPLSRYASGQLGSSALHSEWLFISDTAADYQNGVSPTSFAMYQLQSDGSSDLQSWHWDAGAPTAGLAIDIQGLTSAEDISEATLLAFESEGWTVLRTGPASFTLFQPFEGTPSPITIGFAGSFDGTLNVNDVGTPEFSFGEWFADFHGAESAAFPVRFGLCFGIVVATGQDSPLHTHKIT